MKTQLIMLPIVAIGLMVPGLVAAERSGMSAQARFERSVRHELAMLPYYGVFDVIGFRAEGDTVTLVGQVTRPTLRTDAERILQDVEGVEKVVNRIEVLPLSSNDDQIRRQVYNAVYGESSLNRYAYMAVSAIHIIVKNGHVTLEGAVDTERDRNVAGIQANGVAGVFSVTNRLQVEKP